MTEPGREGAQGQPQSGPPVHRRWRSLLAAGVVAVTGTLALIALHRPAIDPSGFVAVETEQAPPAPAPDPLRTELLRCRTLEAGVDDAGCRAAWEESRRHFFGEPSEPNAPRAAAASTAREVTPSVPASPASARTPPAPARVEAKEH